MCPNTAGLCPDVMTCAAFVSIVLIFPLLQKESPIDFGHRVQRQCHSAKGRGGFGSDMIHCDLGRFYYVDQVLSDDCKTASWVATCH